MKRIISILVLGWAMAGHAALIINQTVNEALPDGNGDNVALDVNLSGFSGAIASLKVNLDINGTFNGDLYAMLSHGGQTVILLNRPGVSTTDTVGYGDPGLNVTFVDGAPNIHTYESVTGALTVPLTGTWGVDGRAVSPYLVNGTEPVTTGLSSFSGLSANGDWILVVADVSGGDLNTLVSWSVDASLVPESNWFGFGGATVGLLVAGISLRTLRRKAVHGRP
jgi:hypothetical protein